MTHQCSQYARPSYLDSIRETYAPRPFTDLEHLLAGFAIGLAVGVLLMHYAGVLS